MPGTPAPESFGNAAKRGIGDVWMENGRLVSVSLADPEVWARVERLLEEERKDLRALKRVYQQMGLLNRHGKLSKNYGG